MCAPKRAQVHREAVADHLHTGPKPRLDARKAVLDKQAAGRLDLHQRRGVPDQMRVGFPRPDFVGADDAVGEMR